MSQTQRLLDYIQDHPGATALEITLECGILNVTGRVSDLRAEGWDIQCRYRGRRRFGYWLIEHPAQLTLTGDAVTLR